MVIDKKLKDDVRDYIMGFLEAEDLSPNIQTVEHKDMEGCLVVSIFCAFPSVLIGEKGKISNRLAKGLSLHLNLKVKINIKKYARKKDKSFSGL